MMLRGGPFNTRGVSMVFLPKQIIIFFFTRKHNIFFLPDQKQTTLFLRIFFQEMFKEPFNCETGMPGTITCRPTVASRVHSDNINISN